MAHGVLDGKVAVITGGGGDMARGIARALSDEGAVIALADIDLAGARANAADIERRGGTALPVECDIRNSVAVDRAVQVIVTRFGTVDILVNNATAARTGVSFEDLTDADLELAFGTGPFGMVYFMRACFPHLKGGARVVNMRSGSELGSLTGHASYVGSKGAMGAMSKVAARDWGVHGITVNCIMPFVLHEKYRESLDQAFQEQIFANLSIKRSGDAETDIGRTVVFLAGPDSSYITGCTINVSGGGYFL